MTSSEGEAMRSIVLSDEDYDRLTAAADAEGITPVQWLVNLARRETAARADESGSDLPPAPDPEG
jgi:hypothetical protein